MEPSDRSDVLSFAHPLPTHPTPTPTSLHLSCCPLPWFSFSFVPSSVRQHTNSGNSFVSSLLMKGCSHDVPPFPRLSRMMAHFFSSFFQKVSLASPPSLVLFSTATLLECLFTELKFCICSLRAHLHSVGMLRFLSLT